MKNEKMHLIPQAVIDVAENLANTKQNNLRENYVVRLEAIREYCDDILKRVNSPTSKVFDNKTKSQLNYSRIGRNNV